MLLVNLATKRFLLLLVTILSLSFLISPVFATSETINFQGKIVRNDTGFEGLNVVPGTPSCVIAGNSNDTCDFRVKYYNANSAGTLLGTEVFNNVEIGYYGGIFNLTLGSGSYTSGSETSFRNIFLNNSGVFIEIDFAPDGTSYTETFLDSANLRMGVRAAAYAISSSGANKQFQFDVSNDATGYSGIGEGQVFFDGDDNVLKLYDGSQWLSVQAYVGNYPSLWLLNDVPATDVIYNYTGLDIAFGGTNSSAPYFYDVSEQLLTLTNTTSGNSFRVNDQISDTSPFVIDASGNVGIGTETPSAKLVVEGGRTILNANGEQYTLGIGRTDGAGKFWMGVNASATPSLTFKNDAGADRLIVADSGLLTQISSDGIESGIVLKRPTTDSTHVQWQLFGQTNNKDFWITAFDGTNTRNFIKFYWDTLSTNFDTGNVGIGVATPLAFFGIKAATTSSAQINLVSSAGVNPSAPNSGDLWWNGTNLYFYDGSTNVDILVGTGGPGGSLFTDGGAITYLTSTTDDFALGGTGSSSPLFFDAGAELLTLTNTTAGLSFRVNDEAGDTTPFVIDASGNVGIGTSTPSGRLDIAGASSTISNSSGDITIDATSGNISFAGDSLTNVLNATFSGDVNVNGGQLKLGNHATNPTSTGEGSLVYNSTDKKLYYYKDTGWSEVGKVYTGSANQTLYHNGTDWAATSALQNDGTNITATGQVRVGNFASKPSGTGAGALVYDTTLGSLFVYDGADWRALSTSQMLSTNGTVSDGSYLQLTHNLNTFDLISSAWVKVGTQWKQALDLSNSVIQDFDNEFAASFNQKSKVSSIAIQNNATLGGYDNYAVYVSDEIHTPMTTSWGSIFWTENLPASTEIQFQTRSGATPDSTDGTWDSWKRTPTSVSIQSADTHTSFTGTNATVADGDITRNIDYYEDEDEFTTGNITKFTNTLANGYAESTIGATDISGARYIVAWIRSSVTGNVFKLGFGEAAGTEQERTFFIDQANTWQKVYWDISAIASGSRDAVTKFRVTNTQNSSINYIDNVVAQSYVTAPSGSAITTTLPNEYIQYRAILTSTNLANTPTLSNIRISYTNPDGTYTIDANRILRTSDRKYYQSNRLNITSYDLDDLQKVRTIVGTNSVSQSSDAQIGTGSDGAITVASTGSINTTNYITGRSCADGGDAVNYSVSSLTSTTATLESTPSSGCLAVGDEVLLINLQGTTSVYPNVGNFETLRIESINTSTITFTTSKTKFYGDNATDDTNIGLGTGNQTVMLQRVPNYTNVTVNASVSFTPDNWVTPTGSANNGAGEGGVMFFRATGTVSIGASGFITSAGRGYLGGDGGPSGRNPGGYLGESYNNPGAATGSGGGTSTAAASAGGRAGREATASPNNGIVTGGGGGGGVSGTNNGDETGGGGGGGGHIGGGGGGAGGNWSATSVSGGAGGASGVAGGGGGGCISGGAGGTGGNAGSAGSTSVGTGGQVGSGPTSGSGGGGCNVSADSGAGGGGGGGLYGVADLSKITFGSGGGGGGGSSSGSAAGEAGGRGGGIVNISAGTISNSGTISASGSQGGQSTGGGNGGSGAGGSVRITGNSIVLGTTVASGGAATNSALNGGGGGGGGDGIVAVYYFTSVSGSSTPTASTATTPSYNYGYFISDEIPTTNATEYGKLTWNLDTQGYGTVQLQTRSGASNNSTDGSWEAWKPVVADVNTKVINSMDTHTDFTGTNVTVADGDVTRNIDYFEDEDESTAGNLTKLTSTAANGYAQRTISSTDLSNYDYIAFWVRAGSTGNIVKAGFGESSATEQEKTFHIDSTNTWQKVYWDISGIDKSLRNAVTLVRFTVIPNTTTVYIDNLEADRYLRNNAGSEISSSPNQYIQYRAVFTTTNESYRPVLYNVGLAWKSGYKMVNVDANTTRLYNYSGQTQDLRINITTGGGASALGNGWTEAGGNIYRATGNVGVGDATPDTTLKVVGSLCVKADANNCAGSTAGTIYANNTSLQNADLAEMYKVSDNSIEAGDVVSFSKSEQSEIEKSKYSNGGNLMGVISTAPGLIMNDAMKESHRPVALIGRVPVKVIVGGNSIKEGDSLGVSYLEGFGSRINQPGYSFGKAIDNTLAWGEQICSTVENISKIKWPKDNGKNEMKPCFRVPVSSFEKESRDGLMKELSISLDSYVIVGKINAYVSVQWYQPDWMSEGIAQLLQEFEGGNLGGTWSVDGERLVSLKDIYANSFNSNYGMFNVLSAGILNIGEGNFSVDTGGNISVAGDMLIRGNILGSDGNISFMLGDSLGEKSFEIKNSDGKIVFSVDSKGEVGGEGVYKSIWLRVEKGSHIDVEHNFGKAPSNISILMSNNSDGSNFSTKGLGSSYYYEATSNNSIRVFNSTDKDVFVKLTIQR